MVKSRALADSQPSTQDGASGIVTPEATIHIEGGYAQYGDYIGVSLADNQTLEISQKLSKISRFVFLIAEVCQLEGELRKILSLVC